MPVPGSRRVVGVAVATALTVTALAPGVTLGSDRQWMERVNVSATGDQDPAGVGERVDISADGQFVAFVSGAPNLVPDDTNGETDVFVRDRSARTTKRSSISWRGKQANSFSYGPAASRDGRFVAFTSEASNLNEAGDTNGESDVFLRGPYG